ncbi:C-type lectin domain family 2 member L-like [Ambystoma mexicanum]|uniref:C-type lectin domain family 2 member L-like n=1 Tax=Ambystoma mexicanum TaxID=8296 RepID=UPI0037E86DB2
MTGRLKVTEKVCPEDWMWFEGQCFFFSERAANWITSQEYCSQSNGSLAVFKNKHAMETIKRLSGETEFWFGVRYVGNEWKWPDGSPVTETGIAGTVYQGAARGCGVFSAGKFTFDVCTTTRHFMCNKKSPAEY